MALEGLNTILPQLPPNVVNAIWITTIMVFFAALVFFVFFFLLRYNVSVKIMALRGKGITVLSDVGRIIKDKKTNRPAEYKTLFTRKRGPYYGGEYLFPMKGLFKKFMLIFHEDSQGDLHPVSLVQNSPLNLNVDPQDIRFWFSETMDKNQEEFTKQTFWQKYGTIVLQFSFMAIMFVLFFLLIVKFGEVGEGLSNAASALSSIG